MMKATLIAFTIIFCKLTLCSGLVQKSGPLQCQYGEKECDYDHVHSKVTTCFSCSLKDVEFSDDRTSTIDTTNNPKSNTDVKQLFLSGGTVKYIPSEISVKFPSLHGAIIKNQKLEVFDDNFLKHVGQLERFYFLRSAIKEIKANSFTVARNLNLINFGTNKIEKIHPDAFKNLAEMLVLGLIENQLTSIDKLWFKDIPKLTHLFLFQNLIEEIGAGTFSSLTNLRILDLSYNKITNVHLTAFQGANNLESIDLSHNLLNKLTPKIFSTLLKLNQLKLKSNLCINMDFETVKELEAEMIRLPCVQN